jgi:hypothetical protein
MQTNLGIVFEVLEDGRAKCIIQAPTDYEPKDERNLALLATLVTQGKLNDIIQAAFLKGRYSLANELFLSFSNIENDLVVRPENVFKPNTL